MLSLCSSFSRVFSIDEETEKAFPTSSNSLKGVASEHVSGGCTPIACSLSLLKFNFLYEGINPMMDDKLAAN